MNVLVENWYLIIAAIAVLTVAGYSIYVFANRPTDSQIQSVKEWLLYAVTMAEKALGSGTGQLKLRYVYNMFIEKFPYMSKIITFDMFSGLVDEALETMRHLMETNTAIEEYVTDGKNV